jgi:hypothetical protein
MAWSTKRYLDQQMRDAHHRVSQGPGAALSQPKVRNPKRGRLWLADRSCIRLRTEQRNHVWSYDFVADRTPRWTQADAQRQREAQMREVKKSSRAGRNNSGPATAA